MKLKLSSFSLFFLFAIAMGTSHAQSNIVADWLEPYDKGLIDLNEGDGSDSLRITTKYLYGSVVRAIGGNIPEYQKLTASLELAVLANSNKMPMPRLRKEKDFLVTNLLADGMQVLFEARNKGMDIAIYATSDEDVVDGFVAIAVTPEQELMVFDFQGEVNISEVLSLFMNGNFDQLENMMNLTKSFDFD
ncbi:MAG: DUF4252 domain-containing protein [Bacteroidota bacterium]